MTKIEMIVVAVILAIIVAVNTSIDVDMTPRTPENCVDTGYKYRGHPIVNCKGR